jgi:hypothetical protein
LAWFSVTRIAFLASTFMKAGSSIIAHSEFMTIVFVGLANRFYVQKSPDKRL